MPMIIKSRTTHTFSLNGSPEWEVSDVETKDVDGEKFVPLPPRQCSLIMLVVHDCNDVPKIVARERPTLGNLPGYKHLIDARNSLQAKEFEPANAGAINSIWRTCATATQKKGCAALLRHTRCARRASTRCCDSHAQGKTSG